jgi:hypothetical protein
VFQRYICDESTGTWACRGNAVSSLSPGGCIITDQGGAGIGDLGAAGIGSGGSGGAGGTGDHNADAAADANHDAGASYMCPGPVCTSDGGGSCQKTWAEVLATPPLACDDLWVEFRGTCGAYNVDELVNGDSGSVWYYDASTGQLAAIYYISLRGESRGVGPPDGISCGVPSLVKVCVADAGADAPH